MATRLEVNCPDKLSADILSQPNCLDIILVSTVYNLVNI